MKIVELVPHLTPANDEQQDQGSPTQEEAGRARARNHEVAALKHASPVLAQPKSFVDAVTRAQHQGLAERRVDECQHEIEARMVRSAHV